MTTRHLLAPTAGTGLLMAAYLLLRPYGDAAGDTSTEAARAFASLWWLVSHACGALALAAFGWLALRVHDLSPGGMSRAARWTGLAGTVLVLPYYGAETFALHELGAMATAGDPSVLELTGRIRNHPLALTTFGAGMLGLAASGVLTALTWQRHRLGQPGWAAWPLGLGVALVLPQFFLPPVGRMAFGVAYAAAAGLLTVTILRNGVRQRVRNRTGKGR